MNNSNIKMKAASFILGVIGVMWFVSIVFSISDLSAFEILFRIGAGFSSISLALEPALLFKKVSTQPKVLLTYPKLSVPTLILTACAILCFLLAGLVWITT